MRSIQKLPKYHKPVLNKILKPLDILITCIALIFFRFDRKYTIEWRSKRSIIAKIRKKIECIYRDKFVINKFVPFFLTEKERFDFNGIYLPDFTMGEIDNMKALYYTYKDVLSVYCEHNDNYFYKIVDKLDSKLPEGVYCYTGVNGEDITIKKGDTVIDAGAWIGDFSAYAAKKGANVYAFEPAKKQLEWLEKTAEWNGAITICPYGLGEKSDTVAFDMKEEGNLICGSDMISENGNTTIKIITLDSWVKEKNILKVDFIKADIEGFERNMLKGATWVLKNMQPKLSICTYHIKDDPEVLKDIILKANPKYKVMQRKMKLFAYVSLNS